MVTFIRDSLRNHTVSKGESHPLRIFRQRGICRAFAYVLPMFAHVLPMFAHVFDHVSKRNMKKHEEDDAKRNPARVMCDSRGIKEQPLEEHAQAEHGPQEQPLKEHALQEQPLEEQPLKENRDPTVVGNPLTSGKISRFW